MWPWYEMHINVCMALFVCVICQPVHVYIFMAIQKTSFYKSVLILLLTCYLYRWLTPQKKNQLNRSVYMHEN